MPPSARIQARLAAADQELLRRPGSNGDRERRRVLAGARIAVISPGWVGKRFIYERAAGLGVDLVLVGEADSWARELVTEGIASRYLDMDLVGDPEVAASTILEVLADEVGLLDGVVTFWEDAVPATMRVAERLGLPGSPPAAADAARNKQRTLDASRAAGIPTAAFVHLAGAASLGEAASQVGFPAVIKPAFGAEALGCVRVNDLAELEAGFGEVSRLVRSDFDPIFEQGEDLLLVEYLDGLEYDIDIVLADGACVFATVSQNWPTKEPGFAETGLQTPAACSPEHRAALVDLSVQTALALGFRDAALHTEAKYTSRGPRLLEVNARLAGARIVDFHRMVTGVDLIETAFLIAAGIPVAPLSNAEPACGVAAAFVYAPRSGTLVHTTFLDHLAGDPSVFQAELVAAAGDAVTASIDGFPTEVAEISVRGADMPAALAHLRSILETLDIPVEAASVEAAPGPVA